MLTGPFLDRNWMGQNPDYASSDIIMLGLPFDGTVSYRPGSRFAPEQISLQAGGWKNILLTLINTLRTVISMMPVI